MGYRNLPGYFRCYRLFPDDPSAEKAEETAGRKNDKHRAWRQRTDDQRFYGTIVAINGDTVIVEFGNNKNCRIPMSKQAISQVEKANAASIPAAPSQSEKKFFGRKKAAQAEEAMKETEAPEPIEQAAEAAPEPAEPEETKPEE